MREKFENSGRIMAESENKDKEIVINSTSKIQKLDVSRDFCKIVAPSRLLIAGEILRLISINSN